MNKTEFTRLSRPQVYQEQWNSFLESYLNPGQESVRSRINGAHLVCKMRQDPLNMDRRIAIPFSSMQGVVLPVYRLLTPVPSDTFSSITPITDGKEHAYAYNSTIVAVRYDGSTLPHNFDFYGGSYLAKGVTYSTKMMPDEVQMLLDKFHASIQNEVENIMCTEAFKKFDVGFVSPVVANPLFVDIEVDGYEFTIKAQTTPWPVGLFLPSSIVYLQYLMKTGTFFRTDMWEAFVTEKFLKDL